MEDYKKRKKGYLALIIQIIYGAFVGIILAFSAEEISESADLDIFLCFAFLIIVFYIFYLFSLIAHEAGHLVFGLATGYAFSSFRIGNLMLSKENGKKILKKFSIPGTVGQCLMSPPKNRKDDIPFVLYNLGGVIVNFIFAVVFSALFFIFRNIVFLSHVFLIFAICNIFQLLLNGVPMRYPLVDNDAYNVLSVQKSKLARCSFYTQLVVSELSLKNTRMKDMPSELIYMPNDEEIKNSMNATVGALFCQRLLDMHDFKGAKESIEHILRTDNGLAGINRNALVLDCMYCELVGECSEEKTAALLKELSLKEKRFLKAKSFSSSVFRTQYTYALLKLRDEAAAEKIMSKFEKFALSYPLKADIESERELMSIAKEKYYSKKI